MNSAKNYIGFLQKYEKANKKFNEVHDEQEQNNFISIWLDNNQKKKFLEEKKCKMSEIVPDWNNWYKDVNLLFFNKL